eukprot:TRINITY_DN1646_c0_g1_i1.p1 TRINITY_DN1646_c0_g1~~TRINITY_DN1646_c0_g1_i1.p1  ORF type:complete len:420 (-),score=131.56 TRINITY_DN1646_c0_g1_i1:21-1280(-)
MTEDIDMSLLEEMNDMLRETNESFDRRDALAKHSPKTSKKYDENPNRETISKKYFQNMFSLVSQAGEYNSESGTASPLSGSDISPMLDLQDDEREAKTKRKENVVFSDQFNRRFNPGELKPLVRKEYIIHEFSEMAEEFKDDDFFEQEEQEIEKNEKELEEEEVEAKTEKKENFRLKALKQADVAFEAHTRFMNTVKGKFPNFKNESRTFEISRMAQTISGTIGSFNTQKNDGRFHPQNHVESNLVFNIPQTPDILRHELKTPKSTRKYSTRSADIYQTIRVRSSQKLGNKKKVQEKKKKEHTERNKKKLSKITVRFDDIIHHYKLPYNELYALAFPTLTAYINRLPVEDYLSKLSSLPKKEKSVKNQEIVSLIKSKVDPVEWENVELIMGLPRPLKFPPQCAFCKQIDDELELQKSNQ